MLLRASGEANETEIDLSIVTGRGGNGGGVAHAEVLVALAEACHDGADPGPARDRVAAAVGSAGLVDAAAVVAQFHMMDRLADATGVPLDEITADVSADFRGELGIDDYAGALS